MKKLYYAGLILGGFLLATSCVDDKYDLSDIDTTTAIKLDNLVVPVNLETITLDQVLDIDEENPDEIIKVKTDASGKKYYAIQKDGNFSADDIEIGDLVTDDVTVEALGISVDGLTIEKKYTNFSYLINSVDESLVALNYLGIDPNNPMQIGLSVTSASGTYVNLENLVVSIPPYFDAYYKGEPVQNGIVEIGNLENGEMKEPIYVYAINYGSEGIRPFNGKLELKGDDIGIESATIVSTGISYMKAQFSMSGFTAMSVSGQLNYKVDAPEINPVSLDDLPDFLKDKSTNIILDNPQIYLDFSNPTKTADFFTDLTITPIGNNGKELKESLDPFNGTIILAADIDNLPLVDIYPGAVKQPITSLKTILAGDGLPESLSFSLDNTSVRGEVLNFQLGQPLGLSGRYTFFTPLSFEAGSKIIYSKSETDFFGDDMEDVKVEKLNISATASTTLPFAATLIAKPLDKNGNPIPGVEAKSTLPANAKDYPFDVEFNQSFTGLDGIYYEVQVEVENDESISPDQSITFKNIRAMVSGQYVTKL